MNLNPEVETVGRCVLCGAEPASDEWFAHQLGLIPPYAIQICQSCGLRWLSPRPSANAYRDIYSRENYFGGANSAECYERLITQRRLYFTYRMRLLEHRFGPRRPLRIMDIGAGTGEFVMEARRRGHRADGIEFSADARTAAKTQYDIDLLDTDTAALPKGHFDVIHMNHVFEHVLDPALMLQQCYAALSAGGLLALEVPQQVHNDLDRLKRLLKRTYPPKFDAYSLHHTYFFNPHTLKGLVKKNGFDIVFLRTTNRANRPLHPFSGKALFLAVFLLAADALHRGGDIIELLARKRHTN